jgi:flagellar hook protein FlgE
MFSGVSGLRSHQTMMDVIGNNIANVNTVGYKSSSVVFTDLLSQLLNGAGAPLEDRGGTNPAAVGLGVQLAGISTDFSQGAAQLTGRALDLSISGDGFFVVEQGGQQLYTRSGSLSFDALGRLVTPGGAVIQGWTADTNGVINTNGPVGNLTMPLGQTIPPAQTGRITIGGNLDASAAVNTVVSTSIEVFDQQGTAYTFNLDYEKTAADEWTLHVTQQDPADPSTPIPLADIDLVFDPTTGELDTANSDPLVIPTDATSNPDLLGQWDGNDIVIDPGTAGAAGALTQFSGDNGVAATDQDGFALGSLQSFTIGANGVVTGVFSNGRNRAIGQLAMASFANPVGLEKLGDSLYRPSPNSGLVQVGPPGAGGRGTITGSTLEMSNVDLAREFTNLIVAQRGFQANSRVITTSDELLQELVNLKR